MQLIINETNVVRTHINEVINWKYFFNIIEIEPINIGLTLFFGNIIEER